MRETRQSIRFTPEEIDRLRKIADQIGATVTFVVRYAVKKMLKEGSEPKFFDEVIDKEGD